MSDQGTTPPPEQGGAAQPPVVQPAQTPPVAFQQTPKGPSGPRAGFWRRFAAWLIDVVIVGIVFDLVSLAFGDSFIQSRHINGTTSIHVGASGLAFLIPLALTLVYYGYFEGGATGQTLGKKLLGIRVIDFQTGGPIGFARGALRLLGRIVSGFVCYLGYLWMLWDKEKQTWHDKIATTLVVPVDAYPVSR